MTTEPDWDEFERLGLYDPASARAEQRRDLLRHYVARGVTVEAMLAAADRGRLVTLLGDRDIRPGRDQYTVAELAERVGLTEEQVVTALRTAGLPGTLPDDRYLGDDDVELLEGFAFASELFGMDNVLHFVRVMGTAASAVAAGAINLASVNFSGALALSGATELEMSEANATTVAALQTVPQALEAIFRHHVEHELRRSLLVETEPGSRTARLAVGFLDLVGFTLTAADLAAEDLVGTVSGFEALAGDVIADHGARLVKVIGDEVMYVTHDPTAACTIALEITGAVARDPRLTAVRGGITHGEVVALDGDYYGNEVNLAARAVAAAEPGQVLVSKDVAIADGVIAEPTGAHDLKGFAEPVELFALSATSP